MRVLIIEPLRMPRIAEIKSDLASMQEIVGGLIEVVYLPDNVLAICNEEGRLMNLQGNRRIGENIIAGTFFLCSDSNTGDFESLSQSQINKFSLWMPEVIEETEVQDIPMPKLYIMDTNGNWVEQ